MIRGLSRHIQSEELALRPVIDRINAGETADFPSNESARFTFVRLWNLGVRNIEQDGAIIRPA